MLSAWPLTNIQLWLHLLTFGHFHTAPEPIAPFPAERIFSTETGSGQISHLKSWPSEQLQYAMTLHVEVSQITNLPLYRFVNEWIGAPYKYAGKDKNGIDCSGFVAALYGAVYQKEVFGPSASLPLLTVPVAKNDLQEGDLLFFNTRGSSISHVGVYLQNGFFVHASIYRGITINHLDENYYQRTFVKAGRVQ